MGTSVAEVMISAPKVHPSASTTVAAARSALADDHVHMVLLVDETMRLVGTVIRDDLPEAPDDLLALDVARLEGRTVKDDEPVERLLTQLRDVVPRRLAVVDDATVLRGLVCLKRSLRGFCDDAGVAARAAER